LVQGTGAGAGGRRFFVFVSTVWSFCTIAVTSVVTLALSASAYCR